MTQPLTLSIVLDADNKGLVGNVRVSKKELDKLNKSVDNTGDSSARARDKMGRFVKKAKDVGTESRKANSSVGALASGFGGLKSMLAGIGIGVVVKELAMGIDTMQGLEAQLKTITGDWASANVELERLIGFAKQTPYDLNQSVEAFTKLTHLGLNPSERAMKSYGNTASAMGKDLMQMIEAVADASVGEFERLKEFGIKASQQGDKVRLTFQGNTTEIAKDAKSIQDYLLAIGENQFGTAMEDQMTRLGAKYSNFKMEVLQLADALGDAGLTAAFSYVIDGGAEMVGMFTDIVKSGVVLDELTIWASQFNDVFNATLNDFGLGREVVDEFANDSIGFLGVFFDFFIVGIGEIGSYLYNWAPNARAVFHIIIGESEIAYENLKTGMSNLSSYTQEGWEKIAHAAGAAWLWVELQFAGMMDGILLTMASGLDTLANGVSSLPGMSDVAASIRGGADSLVVMADAQALVKSEIEQSNIEHLTTLNLIAEKRNLAAADNQATINEINQRIAKVIEERNVMIASSNKMRDAAKSERDAKKATSAKNAKSGKSFSNPEIDFKYDDSGMKKLIADVDKLGGSWSSTGDVMTEAFGSMADNINALSNSQSDYNKLQNVMGEERENIMKIDDLGERESQLKKLDKVESDVSASRLSSTVGSFAAITGAASQMFDEQSKGREALHKMEQAFTIVEVALAMQKAGANAIAAITTQGEGDPYTAWARIAAMAALMTGLGVFSGSVGTAPESAELRQESQGAGTVLGSDDKSASIENAYSRIEDLELEQYAELQDMNAQLRDLNNNITHLATSLVIQYGSFDEDSYDGFLGTKSNSSTNNLFGDALGSNVGGLVDSIIGSFSKTKVSLLDSGISFDSQTLGKMFQDGFAQLSTYNDVKTKKSSWWGASSKTSYSTEYSVVDSEVSTEVSRIFQNIGDNAISAVELLGLDVTHSLESFVIDLPNISFKDMSGDEIQAELEAIFSQQSDLIATWLVPSMQSYQSIGEGLYDTLIRVAQEQAIFNEALEQSGLSLGKFGDVSSEVQIAISQSIIHLAGGIEEFQELTSSYFSEFFSESEQFDYLASQLTQQFYNLGYYVPANVEQFRGLVESLDLTTDAGQKTYAALMQLVPASAEYYEQLEQQAEDLIELSNNLASTLDTIFETTALSDLIAEQELYLSEQQTAADELYSTEMQRYSDSISANESIINYLNSIQLGDLSTLTPEQQLAEAQAQFDTVMSAAQNGDVDAANSATGIASSFLTIARDFYASSDDYSDIFVDVNNQLSSIADLMGLSEEPTETTISESAELISLREQLAEETAVNTLNENTELVELLSSQLNELSLAKDESILSLIDSMGIDLAGVSTTLGLDLNDVISTLGLEFQNLGENLDISIPAIAAALGTDLVGLAETLGVDLGSLDSSFDVNLQDVAKAFGIDISALADTLGVDLTSLLTSNTTGLDDVATAVQALELDVSVNVEPLITIPQTQIDDYINVGVGDVGNIDFSYLDGLGAYDWGYANLYANGGIASTPSIFGEAGPEAAVPLPDGRSIPVTFSNNNSNSALVDEVRLLRDEVVKLRTENLAIADGATLQRDNQNQSTAEASDRTINALKVPIDTRRIA